MFLYMEMYQFKGRAIFPKARRQGDRWENREMRCAKRREKATVGCGCEQSEANGGSRAV